MSDTTKTRSEYGMITLDAAPPTPARNGNLMPDIAALQSNIDQTRSLGFFRNPVEVQKYVVNSNHGYLGYAVITNKKFWDSLPTDVRNQLEKAMVEATEYANGIAKEENATAMAAVKASGKSTIIELTAEEELAMKKALFPVHKAMAARIGQDLIDAVYKETGFDPSKL